MTEERNRNRYSKSLLAVAASLALLPGTGVALDFADSPPGTLMPYVAPNIIISVDDSGSMQWRASGGSSNGTNEVQPPFKSTTRRMNVLKYALGGYNGTGGVFRDKTLLPDGKIRLAWQVMHNNPPGKGIASSPGADTVGSSPTNSMKVLDEDHRDNFLSFVSKLTPGNNTPSHIMMRLADEYMRESLGVNSAWAFKPGEQAEPYLACRRSYHIFMTDGRWNAYNTNDRKSTATNGPETDLGNYDGKSHTLPDGAFYDVTSDQTRIYRDNAGLSGSSDNRAVLADWALHSWAENMQPSIWDPTDNTKRLSVSKKYEAAPETEMIGGKQIQKYWNPKYNPATWPHMTTFTIGFSEDAITWPGASSIIKPTNTVPFGWDGSFPNLVNGTLVWPVMSNENRRALDLWHAAINGRGAFYAVSDPDDLEQAFRDIIEQINAENEVDASSNSTAASGSNTSRNDVGLFATSFKPDEAWKGEVTARAVAKNGNVTDLWGGKSTADMLDVLSDNDAKNGRIILSYNDDPAVDAGVPFRFAQLSSEQQASLNTDGQGYADTLGSDRVDYIRGDRSREGSPFRPRESRQGDIVNSEVWYEPGPVSNFSINGYAAFAASRRNRTPMVYVGGNDGMLHGFSAVDGKEKLAYVPKGVMPQLRHLTDISYTHRYFVDGSPLVGDIATTTTPSGASDWKTVLVGTLGAGGKGYFVLDVTDPDSDFDENKASNLVRMDKTLPASEPSLTACAATPTPVECHFGHIFSSPVRDDSNPIVTTQIARMNNDRWAVIMGNGYNSRSQQPVLLIQYLDNGELLHISASKDTPGTGNANDNGLSAPRVVDINGDDRADLVYAGDLQGNVWKFDLTSTLDSEWHVAFDGLALYTAVGSTLPGGARNVRQPITTAPTVKENNRGVGGMMVVFGTGRNVTEDDPNSLYIQSLYGVLDNTHYEYRDSADPSKGIKVSSACTPDPCPPSPVGTGVTNLVERTVGSSYDGEGQSAGYTFWALDDPKDGGAAEPVDWETDRGWYMDLPKDGERLLKNFGFYAGTNILGIYTQVPSKGETASEGKLEESCVATDVVTGRQFLTLLNIMDGRRPAIPLLDLNGDGLYGDDDHDVSRVEVAVGGQTMTSVTVTDEDENDSERIKIDGVDEVSGIYGRLPPELALRPSWRQMR